MRKPTDHSHKPPDPRDPETFDLAFRAHAFRTELDALLDKHGMRLVLAHQGKWAHVQVQWPGASQAVSIMRTTRDGKVRYLTKAEEDAADLSPA
jgi:hypothetical protein